MSLERPSFFQPATPSAPALQNKLIDMGCNKETVAKVISANVIQNDETLLRALSHIEYPHRNCLAAWELYCLSGEINAIAHAIQNENLTGETKGESSLGRNALHYTALSGKVAAMDYVKDVLNIPVESCNNIGANVLLHAALGGEVAAMRHAREVYNIPANSSDTREQNALLLAGQSGVVAAMRYAANSYVGDITGLGISPGCCNKIGANTLHYAAWGGSVEAIDYAITTLGISVDSTDYGDGNAFLYAAWSGVVDAMRHIRTLSNIPADAYDGMERNAFCFAAMSNSVNALRYLKEELRLEAKIRNSFGANILHYIMWGGGSTDAINYAVNTLNIARDSTNADGRNGLHFAASSGSIQSIINAITVLQIPVQSLDSLDRSILHHAAWAGSAPAVRYIRTLGGQLELSLSSPAVELDNANAAVINVIRAQQNVSGDKNQYDRLTNSFDVDKKGHDAFHFARQSGNPDAVHAVLNMTLEQLLAKPQPENTATAMSGPQ